MPDVAFVSAAAPAPPAQRRFAASPVGVLLLDSGLRPVYYNTEAANILRYPAKAPQPFSLDGILLVGQS